MKRNKVIYLYYNVNQFIRIFFKFLLYIEVSLVAQQKRIYLPVQDTWLQSLVREDPTCPGVPEPLCSTYWARALRSAAAEPACCTTGEASRETPTLQLECPPLSATRGKPRRQ